jgi:hypothetical protein
MHPWIVVRLRELRKGRLKEKFAAERVDLLE